MCPRAAQVPDRLRTELVKLQGGRFKSKFVFPGKTGTVRDRRNCYCGFERRVIAAGLVNAQGKALFSIHDLRRSFGTNHANAGVSPKILMELMGHSRLETTMTYYVSTSMDQKREAVERVAAKIAAGA